MADWRWEKPCVYNRVPLSLTSTGFSQRFSKISMLYAQFLFWSLKISIMCFINKPRFLGEPRTSLSNDFVKTKDGLSVEQFLASKPSKTQNVQCGLLVLVLVVTESSKENMRSAVPWYWHWGGERWRFALAAGAKGKLRHWFVLSVDIRLMMRVWGSVRKWWGLQTLWCAIVLPFALSHHLWKFYDTYGFSPRGDKITSNSHTQ